MFEKHGVARNRGIDWVARLRQKRIVSRIEDERRGGDLAQKGSRRGGRPVCFGIGKTMQWCRVAIIERLKIANVFNPGEIDFSRKFLSLVADAAPQLDEKTLHVEPVFRLGQSPRTSRKIARHRNGRGAANARISFAFSEVFQRQIATQAEADQSDRGRGVIGHRVLRNRIKIAGVSPIVAAEKPVSLATAAAHRPCEDIPSPAEQGVRHALDIVASVPVLEAVRQDRQPRTSLPRPRDIQEIAIIELEPLCFPGDHSHPAERIGNDRLEMSATLPDRRTIQR